MLQTVPVKDAGAPERSSVEASSLADVELLLDDMRTLLGYLYAGARGTMPRPSRTLRRKARNCRSFL